MIVTVFNHTFSVSDNSARSTRSTDLPEIITILDNTFMIASNATYSTPTHQITIITTVNNI